MALGKWIAEFVFLDFFMQRASVDAQHPRGARDVSVIVPQSRRNNELFHFSQWRADRNSNRRRCELRPGVALYLHAASSVAFAPQDQFVKCIERFPRALTGLRLSEGASPSKTALAVQALPGAAKLATK